MYVRQELIAPLSFNDDPQNSIKKLFSQKFAQNHKVSAKSLPKMEVSQYAGWHGAV